MPQRFRFLLGPAAVGLLLSGAALAAPLAPASPGTSLLTDAETGFTLQVPRTWTVKRDVLGLRVLALAPLESAEDAFAENVTVTTQDFDAPMTLEAYAALSRAQLDQFFDSPRILADEAVSWGERPARRLTLTAMQGGRPLKFWSEFSLVGQRAYVLTFCAEEGQFARYEERFKAVEQTFRVPDAKASLAAGSPAPSPAAERAREPVASATPSEVSEAP